MQDNNDAKKLGRIGGKKTLEKYGKEHYRKMALKRWGKDEAICPETGEAHNNGENECMACKSHEKR